VRFQIYKNYKIRKLKTLFKISNTNPIKYIFECRKFIIYNNLRIKFNLLNILKIEKLACYKPYNLLNYIYWSKFKKRRSVGIFTLQDRCIHLLLKVAIEPYMEPLGDDLSFGFRPGRSSQQAVSSLYNNLTQCKQIKDSTKVTVKKNVNVFRKRHQDKNYFQKISNKIKKVIVPYFYFWKNPKHFFYSSLYLLDVDVDTNFFFNKISYKWLLENIPMPKKLWISFIFDFKNDDCWKEYDLYKCF